MNTRDYLATMETARRRELAYGVLREPPAPSWNHQIILTKLLERVAAHVRERNLGQVAPAPVDVVLDEAKSLVVQPDLVFVSKARLDIIRNQVWGVPDLAVEVLSTSTARYDRSVKLRWYRAYGMPECWFVDPVSRGIRVVDLQLVRSGSVFFEEDEPIRSLVLPDLELRPRDVLTAWWC